MNELLLIFHRLGIDTLEVLQAAAREEYGLDCLPRMLASADYDAGIPAVGHKQFVELGEQDIKAPARPGAVVFDVTAILPSELADGRL